MNRLNKLVFGLIAVVTAVTILAYGAVHQPILILFYLALCALLIMWAADAFASGKLVVSKSTLQIPLMLLAAYGFVQTIPFGWGETPAGSVTAANTISLEPFATSAAAIHIAALAAFVSIALIYIDSARRLRKLAILLTAFGFAYAFYSVLQSVLSPEKIYGIYDPVSATPFGSFVNRHNFAAVMEMLIAVPLGMIFAGAVGRDKLLLAVIAIAMMASSLLLSGSRGGLVALVGEGTILVILTSRARGIKAYVLKGAMGVLLLAAAIGGAVFVGGDTSLTRFAETAQGPDITSDRSQIWSVTVDVIRHHLPFGAGLGAFPQAYAEFDPTSGAARVEQAHNDYLQILADTGVVGLIIGALFLFWFVRTGISHTRVSNTFRRGVAVGAFAGCCGVLLHSFFDFVLHTTGVAVVFLMLLAMLAASGREYVDDAEDVEKMRSKRRKKGSVTAIETHQSSRATAN